MSMLAQLGDMPKKRSAHGAVGRLSPQVAASGGKLVRPLGHELHLRHLVGAVRAQHRRYRSSVARSPQGGRLLVKIQNADGGWGVRRVELQARLTGYEPAPSTPAQTAWALLGLMAAGEVDHPAVARGIAYLSQTQGADGLWAEERFTAVGFPRIFYLRYHGGNAKYFPVWAMARYRNLKRANSPSVAYGM